MRKRSERADPARHEPDSDQDRLAVLIDADNAHAGSIDALLVEIARFGVASVKRIYGDWTQPQLGSWKKILLQHSIVPVQQFGYTKGKNATDSALIIDAMDLMYTRRFDGFCLVSSDSDFTRLASRLREEGLLVYGFGERKTPGPFVSACDKFVYTELLRSHAPVSVAAAGGAGSNASASPAATAASVSAPSGRGPSGRAKSSPAKVPASNGTGASGSAGLPGEGGLPDERKLRSLLGTTAGGPDDPTSRGDADSATGPGDGEPPNGDTESVASEDGQAPVELIANAIDTVSDDSGWASLGAVGRTLTKLRPDFDSRLYGHRKFSDLVRSLPGRFEIEERATAGSGKSIFVRLAARPSRKSARKGTSSPADGPGPSAGASGRKRTARASEA